MRYSQRLACTLLLSCLPVLPQSAFATSFSRVKAHSAVLVNMETGAVMMEQNADAPIPPASITKILSLYLVFESIKEGSTHLSDHVEISKRAAATGGSRMGLRAGTEVSLGELIKGMAVVSGNDACVAVAEHVSGNVERFVRKINAKARELGMTRSRFMTPNGLPAPGQVTTARDIAKLSVAYLRRYPESLSIHSMQSYTYRSCTHRNANRLLQTCPGVDGLKTGFVCASGFNISATAKRGDVRLLAVVMGARTPGIRAAETAKLLDAGFRECGGPEVRYASYVNPAAKIRISRDAKSFERTGKAAKFRTAKSSKVAASTVGKAGRKSVALKSGSRHGAEQISRHASAASKPGLSHASSRGKTLTAKQSAASKTAGLKTGKQTKKQTVIAGTSSSAKKHARTAHKRKSSKS